jgi:hypothetical protein
LIDKDRSFCVVVLFDQQDAMSLIDLEVDNHHILALTPSAELAAQKICSKVSVVRLSTFSHARCVVAARRVLNELSENKSIAELSPGIRVAVCHSAWLLTFLVERVRSSLQDGPWLVRDGLGNWKTVFDLSALLDILLPRMWDHGLVHQLTAVRSPFAKLHRWLALRAASRLQRSSRSWVVAPTHKLRSGLLDALQQEGVGLLVLKPASGRWSDFLSLFKTPNSKEAVWALPVAPLSRSDTRVRETLVCLRALGIHFRDDDLSRAWTCFVERCSAVLPVVLAAVSETEVLTLACGARAAVAFEANNWWSAAVLDGAGRAGVTRAVFNHNSHPPGGGGGADEVLGRLFAHRTCNELVDEAGIWSPAAMRWEVRSLAGGGNTQLQPVKIQYPKPKPPNEIDRFRVLHAGNYQNWSDFFPWVAETSTEYLSGIERLAEVVSGMEGVQIVFRVRPKREVDHQTVRTRLLSQRNITVCGIEQNFLEQLSECDLLICHFSTTVEQALQMGKPVLLWGSSERYTQFKARETPPSYYSRAPVYAVRHASKLPAMLAAIREAHFGRPLTEAECAPYCHPEGSYNMNQWVRKVLGLDRLKN